MSDHGSTHGSNLPPAGDKRHPLVVAMHNMRHLQLFITTASEGAALLSDGGALKSEWNGLRADLPKEPVVWHEDELLATARSSASSATTPNPGDRSLAGRLRTIRRRFGLSQADFAAKVGLDEGGVCRWESGSRTPSPWLAGRVAAILDRLETTTGVAPADLLVAPPPLSYFDRTRWRRCAPPDLTDGGPISLGDRIRHRRLAL